jgi:uncharacterized protein
MIINKNVYIIGATGLIGKNLVETLRTSEYNPIVLTRNPSKAKHLFGNSIEIQLWDGENTDNLTSILDGAKAVVNLAGESIATRWTKTKRESIQKSRTVSTHAVVRAIHQCKVAPEVFIQASAIGYYPHNSKNQFNEEGKSGDGFLSQVVKEWEQVALMAESKTRLVLIRTGVVLSNEDGFMSKILIPVKFFIGGWFGKGDQILSWIHIKDHVKAMHFLIENESCTGAFNLVSPEPISYKLFMKKIGEILKRPVWFPIPSVILKLIFGQMATEVILSNQNIIPKGLLATGYKFEFGSIDGALNDLLQEK